MKRKTNEEHEELTIQEQIEIRRALLSLKVPSGCDDEELIALLEKNYSIICKDGRWISKKGNLNNDEVLTLHVWADGHDEKTNQLIALLEKNHSITRGWMKRRVEMDGSVRIDPIGSYTIGE